MVITDDVSLINRNMTDNNLVQFRVETPRHTVCCLSVSEHLWITRDDIPDMNTWRKSMCSPLWLIWGLTAACFAQRLFPPSPLVLWHQRVLASSSSRLNRPISKPILVGPRPSSAPALTLSQTLRPLCFQRRRAIDQSRPGETALSQSLREVLWETLF